VAATNRDLQQMVAERQFRSDLYYRLNVFPLTLPPLRERPEDIPLLMRHFVQPHARRLRRRIPYIGSRELAFLARYPWPGNAHELSNFALRCLLRTSGSWLAIELQELTPSPWPYFRNPETPLAEAHRRYLLAVLDLCGWGIAGPYGAAQRLGMSRTTLSDNLKVLGIYRGDSWSESEEVARGV
jgi:formate hydrogenlyase transcriptional activator